MQDVYSMMGIEEIVQKGIRIPGGWSQNLSLMKPVFGRTAGSLQCILCFVDPRQGGRLGKFKTA